MGIIGLNGNILHILDSIKPIVKMNSTCVFLSFQTWHLENLTHVACICGLHCISTAWFYFILFFKPSISLSLSFIYLFFLLSWFFSWFYLFGRAVRHAGFNSLTRDGTRAPCIGSIEPQPLNRQGSPHCSVLESEIIVLISYLLSASLHAGEHSMKVQTFSVLFILY